MRLLSVPRKAPHLSMNWVKIIDLRIGYRENAISDTFRKGNYSKNVEAFKKKKKLLKNSECGEIRGSPLPSMEESVCNYYSGVLVYVIALPAAAALKEAAHYLSAPV